MGSLRLRVLLGTALAAGAGAVLAGGGSWWLSRRALLEEADAVLATRLRALAATVRSEQGRPRIDFDAGLLPEFVRLEGPDLGAVWDQDGVPLFACPAALAWTAPPVPADGRPRHGVLPDDRPGRLLAQRLSLAGRVLTVAVGRDTREIDRRLGLVAGASVLGGALGALLAALGAALSVRSLLAPLGRLAVRIAGIDAARPEQRLGCAGVPVELRGVAVRLDELLTRLQAARERERAFTADAAHELRTPLAALRTGLEVAAARERPADHYRAALVEALPSVQQLQHLVDDLLALARLEAGQAELELEPVDPAGLLAACRRELEAAAAERGLRFAEAPVALPPLRSDPGKLRTILRNLLGNAVAHAAAGSVIAITWQAAAGGFRLAIANPGCRLRAEELPRVFDRFWRQDAARSGQHSGLGLPLARRLAELLGGRLEVALDGEVFTATLTLPAS